MLKVSYTVSVHYEGKIPTARNEETLGEALEKLHFVVLYCKARHTRASFRIARHYPTQDGQHLETSFLYYGRVDENILQMELEA